MSESSPKHKLTRTAKGWVRRINGKPRWICSIRVAPTGEAADEFYSKHFTNIWNEPVAPKPAGEEQITIYVVVSAFLHIKRGRRDAGTISVIGCDRYEKVLREFCDAVGRDKPAASIGPDDFVKFARALNNRKRGPLGVHRRKDYIIVVRELFKWASKPPVNLPIPEYGETFAVPTKTEFRRERARRREVDGLMLFTSEEIRAQLSGTTIIRLGSRKPLPIKASPALKAMILLGINCAFGNTDLARLPLSIADKIASGWIAYDRHKTGAERKAWVWPETREAVASYLRVRPKPNKPEYASLMFLTSAGQPYVRIVTKRDGSFQDKRDKIAERYRILLKRLGQARKGRNFYTLRRTCRTIAAETGQELVIALIMGHAGDSNDMARVYTQVVLDSKIEEVCRHVRSRIFDTSLRTNL